MIVFSGLGVLPRAAGGPPNRCWKTLLEFFPCALEVFPLGGWTQAHNAKRNIGTVELPICDERCRIKLALFSSPPEPGS